MKNKNISPDYLPIIQEKGDMCITIIAPTHRLSPDRRTDSAQLEKLIQQAKENLQNKYDNENIIPLTQAIDKLYDQIDFMHNGAGVGLFVSEHVKKLIHFFFPVTEKVLISDSFEIRDLIYQFYYDIPYVVVLLSEKEVKLFNARLNTVTEITNEHFPHKNKAEYEYNRPTRGSSYVGHAFVKEFEKDKSVMEEIRIESFFRESDNLLNSYIKTETFVIIAGDNKDLSYFKKITAHDKNIACSIPGNYMNYNESELGALIWKAMKLFLDNEKEKLIKDFKEKLGKGFGITGIENIWKAVKEGRGFKLLVEKDYSVSGFIMNKDDYELYMYPPKQSHKLLSDVVNNIIEMVLEKNGEVIIVENDSLKDYQRLVLVTRY